MKKKLTLIFTILFTLALISNVKAQDIDNDGVADASDNCKYVWNANQLDDDMDLIGNLCDCEPSSGDPNGQHIPAIIITAAPSTTINSGTLVNFTSTIDAGGTAPIFQWKKNGTNVGINNSTYSDNTLNNGDVITCELTGDVICLSGNVKNSNSLTFTVSILSINDITSDNSKIIIYPNPTKKVLNLGLKIKIKKIDLIDETGKLISHLEIVNNQINIEQFSKGNYLLRIESNEMLSYKRIIIE